MAFTNQYFPDRWETAIIPNQRRNNQTLAFANVRFLSFIYILCIFNMRDWIRFAAKKSTFLKKKFLHTERKEKKEKIMNKRQEKILLKYECTGQLSFDQNLRIVESREDVGKKKKEKKSL